VEEGGCDGRGGSRGHAFKAFFLSLNSSSQETRKRDVGSYEYVYINKGNKGCEKL
jgi:hypothetical protein